jgi:SAM-dependent methyltransferase
VLFLTRHFQKLNARYHSEEGEGFAAQELVPVVARFLPVTGGSVLEVGCGYARNLMALARLAHARRVVGCDVAMDELHRARERVARAAPEERARILLVRQEPFRLPFADSRFEVVVLWQVLEHLFGVASKRRVIAECVRVLKPAGHLVVETPNQLFPFDYHDNKLPLVHWILPGKAREWLTYQVRGMRYPPSEYLTLGGCEKLLREAPGVARITKATKVYFAASFGDAWRDLGGSQTALKRVIFALAAPVHAVMSAFGSSADWILPSLRVVWQVDKAPPDAGRT